MARKFTRALSGCAALLLAWQTMPAFTAAAEDEYLIRDKWGYYTTANHAESEHFVIFYGNNDTTGRVNEAFLQRNLDDYEKLWHCYSEHLGMTDINVDIYGKSTQKYKTCVYLTYTGLDQYPDGWAFMSAEDGYGIEIISPNAMLDDLTIAHEFGHVVTMQQKAWCDQAITGAWWEPLANWFREMYLYSDYYTGSVQTCWFEPYIRNMSINMPHGRNYYEVFPFLVYMSYNPDDLGTLGFDSVKRMISEANPNEYPLDTITRLFGVDAQTVLGNYAKRMATFDFGPKEAYRAEFSRKLREQPFYWNLFYTVLEQTGAETFRVPESEAPMQTGINIVPLSITGDSISVDFKGLSDDTNAGWRACIVTVDAAGNAGYSDLFGDGDSMTVSAAGAQSAYLTVVGTPKEIYPINAFDKENTASCMSSQARRRYPYEIRLTGAEIQQQTANYSRAEEHVHPNGGGIVSDYAQVADTVYVGPNAKVLGSARVSGNARIEDYAIAAGSAVIQDNAVVCGHAIVEGSAKISGNAVVADSAVVTGLSEISGSAKVLQKAYLIERVKMTDNAVAKGVAYVYGEANISGQRILDGDYANGETLTGGGTAFGWLDTAGTAYDDGMIAGYDFANFRTVWAQDKYTTTDALLRGAEWSAERTSAKGVLNFNGSAAVEMEPSVFRGNGIQISLAALWKGGTGSQELFRIGDENAYMAFTPQNADGVAEFTITNGSAAQKLTANAPLKKGEWSKITVQLFDGNGTLLINGAQAASGAVTLTPNDVLGASENDKAEFGKGFKGALDYVNLYFKAAAEPDTQYTGSEEADNELIGDVNLDGSVTAADAVELQKFLMTITNLTAEQAAQADINGDRKINAADLTLLKRMLLA